MPRDRVNLYPIFMDLRSQQVLVVGAGQLAERKLRLLLRAGACATVVAPAATTAIHRWARTDKLVWVQRTYQTRDLRGCTLVFAAIGNETVDQRVARDAAQQHIQTNCANMLESGTFYVPAQTGYAELQLAVSTGGNSPALARRLARDLGDHLSLEHVAWSRLLARLRPLIQSSVAPEHREKLWAELTRDEIHSLLQSEKPRRADRFASQLIRKHRYHS